MSLSNWHDHPSRSCPPKRRPSYATHLRAVSEPDLIRVLAEAHALAGEPKKRSKARR